MKAKNWFIKFLPDIDEFRKEIWAKIPGDKKVEYAWDMVVEAMETKGQRDRLKFKKILHLKRKF